MHFFLTNLKKGFDPHSRKRNIYLHLYVQFFALVSRQSAALSSPLNTQCLQNSAKSGQRSVLTLGCLCLSWCVRDTACSLPFTFLFFHCTIKNLFSFFICRPLYKYMYVYSHIVVKRCICQKNRLKLRSIHVVL